MDEHIKHQLTNDVSLNCVLSVSNDMFTSWWRSEFRYTGAAGLKGDTALMVDLTLSNKNSLYWLFVTHWNEKIKYYSSHPIFLQTLCGMSCILYFPPCVVCTWQYVWKWDMCMCKSPDISGISLPPASPERDETRSHSDLIPASSAGDRRIDLDAPLMVDCIWLKVLTQHSSFVSSTQDKCGLFAYYA